jgi:short-subunit dehydrogenase
MKGKVVIVTGASSGIGLAIAKYFALQGSKVVLAARRTEILAEIETELKSKGCDVFAVTTDVTDEKSCENMVNKVVEKYGRIDVLINNAGISMRAMFKECDLSVLHRVMNVNFWGTINCTKFALPFLLQTQGSVVGLISIAGYQPLPARTAYTASKFAIRGFLDTLRTEYGRQGLHVLIVAPGFISTSIRKKALLADGRQQGITPRDEDKMVTPDAVAKAVYRNIKHRNRYLIMTTLGVATVFVRKFAPRFTDNISCKLMKKEPDSPFK